SLLSMCGCFLFISTYLVPLIQSSSYMQARQNDYQAQDSQEVSAEDKKLKPISRNNSELEAIVNNALDELALDEPWSVYIYDLKDDSSVQINSEQASDAASLYKLFLIEYLEQKLSYNEWANTWLADQSVSDCVYNMLRESDDPCAEDLANYLGLKDVDKFNELNDYKNTSFAGHSGKQTSAADIGKLFVSLKKGQILSDNARRFVFDALYQQDIKSGIAKGCAKDCRTANKRGELSDIAYDAGIVTHGKRDYVLVIMNRGGDFKQITKLTKTVDEYLR
ncbi:MAG: serine hydrolase, partial [Candidatus Saccharimonadales bacterium]